ncbi:hypothetical protein [Mycobacterium sp. 852002-51057_SCH5723018]|uniref:hypothetical protein n=1 Tax=Mycobacterium sp. 852002-51057_SCH5723018 TaxID=1834094 RepID=UPI000AFCBE67|nr:hypothetical protein [Mycobacterium sp. 852002-51057_SCH5723018]
MAAAQGGRVAAQDGIAALAADAQSGGTRGAGAGLTANADACERAGHVWGGGTVQGGTFAGDQSRLAARPGRERRVAPTGCKAADVARAGQPSARGKTGLTTHTATAGAAAASAEAALGGETRLAGKTRLARETRLAG